MADDKLNRAHAVEQLYIQNYNFIRELIYSDPHMTVAAENQILEGIAKYLPEFSGSLTDKSFQSWVTEIVLPLVGFHAIRHLCESSVRTAIRKVFATCLDLGITDDHYQDAEQNTWLWVWEHPEELRDRTKSTAKMKTRLYSVAKFQALTIRKSLLRAKERSSDVALSRIGADGFGNVVIEPLLSRDQLTPYERHETIGARS